MYGYIYKTTNTKNNKIYIGQHKSTEFDPKYLGSGKMFTQAKNKYGRDAFIVELLEECDSRQQLDEREIYYVALFNSRDTDVGYNLTQGGQDRFFTGCKHTDEAKEKMSNRAINRPHPPTTRGRIQITNGTQNKYIPKEELEKYKEQGWYRGRVYDKSVPWNKGLTKEDDPRLMKYSTDRKARFENGESIGCFGVKGNTNGFVAGMTPWNNGLEGYNNGHPNYYKGKKK